MKKRFMWMLTAILVCGFMMMTACSDDDDNRNGNTPDNAVIQAGTYVWGSTIYAMGADGAARLAEVYEKTGIKHVVLLVKGESGTIGYFKNSLSNAPKSRTDRDMLAETVSAMHAKGIKVYAWLVVGVDEAYQEAHPEQSSFHFRRGFCKESIDISQKDYHQYMAKVIKEIDQNYDVDGFALDYVRYQGPYYGWSDSDYELLTTPVALGGYGLTLDEYNELVTLLAKQYGYPVAPNAEGRLVYNANGVVPEAEEEALYNAFYEGNKAAVAFGRMREKLTDDICEYLVSQTSKPSYVATMSECTTDPHIATVAYGLTFNRAYTFDVVCPMLYSADYSADSKWVTQNISYLKTLGYKTIIPSLQAYGDATTTTLTADIRATMDEGCQGYLLFNTGSYDIASPVATDGGTIELTYVRGTESPSGNIAIAISGVTPTAVTMSGLLAGTSYEIDGQKIMFKADALKRMADYGIVTIKTSGSGKISVNVTSDKQIVYNAPMKD